MYGVKTLREELKLEVYGIETKIDLNWYDGMIGAIPVFETKEKALEYADGNESLLFELYEKEKQ